MKLFEQAKNLVEYIYLCLEQSIYDPIILKLGKIPSHYECVWSGCSKCGAKKGKPCKRPWRCESRTKLISDAITQFTAETNKKCKKRYEQWQVEKLKEVVAHWT